MSNLSAINYYISSSIDTYRKDAGKAKILNSSSYYGVLESLERFFHKLEFLLKYGHLPTGDDVIGKNLPKELQGLEDFLNKKNNNYYILQRNPTERYSFSWQGESLNVTRQRYYPSLAEVRCGFVGAEEYRWRAEMTESVNPDAILNILKRPSISPSSASESSEVAGQINTEKQEILPSVESPIVQTENGQLYSSNLLDGAEIESQPSSISPSSVSESSEITGQINTEEQEISSSVESPVVQTENGQLYSSNLNNDFEGEWPWSNLLDGAEIESQPPRIFPSPSPSMSRRDERK